MANAPPIAHCDSYSAQISQLLDARRQFCAKVAPDASVRSAVDMMVKHHIGILLISSDPLSSSASNILGVFSERDFLTKCSDLPSLLTTPVSSIMSSSVLTVPPHFSVGECMAVMVAREIRHLPVVDNDVIVGMVSMRDLVRQVAEDHEAHVKELSSQVTKLANAYHGAKGGEEEETARKGSWWGWSA
mmetsp:Transcript_6169/g.14985  ORF Transcript_6169/g.14985 Transcript_6169/m.14985 type:complete len:188 (-) Transcript_6169:40-603(-)